MSSPEIDAPAQLTPEAKQLLSATVRALRQRLLRDLRDSAEREYRLAVPLGKAGLGEAQRVRRQRLEHWLDERVRTAAPRGDKEQEAARERFFLSALKEAAATWLNRLFFLRHLEARGLSRPLVVTGGWNSKGYRELREFAPGLTHDETEGYGFLLQLLFDELARDLPGLFGEVGLTRLFPIHAATLREIVEQLDAPALSSAWTDDTTLGWVYQYWNDPEREALDKKIADGGKVEPHEIASKTQMFTERYMVEWLLHNSLGLQWLAICQKHGWTPDAAAILPGLDARRAQWRQRRERGEVAPDALMPIAGELEEHWKYYVPQPLPQSAVSAAPESIRDLKILDPACGSGHFLLAAFDLLVALYREEARHRNHSWSDREIAEWILERNLHGVDIDPRAVQIAAAGLYLKAKQLDRAAQPRTLNLVAPALNLARLPDKDPALLQLRREIRQESGIPEELTDRIVHALKGVDHLGTLLKVDDAVSSAVAAYERAVATQLDGNAQGSLFSGFQPQQVRLTFAATKANVLDKLEQFLSHHSGGDDLGLRLDGEQLAAGVRFLRIVKEGQYDLVVGNPPYQGTARMKEAEYIAKKYPRGKADLYAAFLERGLELAKPGGMSALLTMRGWLFLAQYASLRQELLAAHRLLLMADLNSGAFEEISAAQVVVAVAMTIFCNLRREPLPTIALRPTPNDDKASGGMTQRKRAAVLSQAGSFEFSVGALNAVEGMPLLYWWSRDLLGRYAMASMLGDVSPVRQGMATSDNPRFLRKSWEVDSTTVLLRSVDSDLMNVETKWAPYIKGSSGRAWFEPADDVVTWQFFGLALKCYGQFLYGSYSRTIKNESWYFVPGIAFSAIGNSFCARAHRYASIFGHKGPSVFPSDTEATLCMMNTLLSRSILESLNPGIGFEVGDVNRLPIFPVESADQIYATIDQAFTEHEAARESSVEFRKPGPSPWKYAQAWAQRAVDRPAGEPLPPYVPEYEPARPEQLVSFAVGVALGRFAADGAGILDRAPDAALPHGILFLSAASERDSLSHPACALLRTTWDEHASAVGEGDDLRTYLRTSFFKFHKDLYENRPIYFPLSSAKKSFVAWVAIHRFDDSTLQTLLAEHLNSERRTLDGELEDLRKARASADKTARGKAEKRFAEVQKLLTELVDFIDKVQECAERGPPAADPKAPPRQADARFRMDLDDGVMVNSAALWPLLEPQWKDPRKWWKELAAADGRKDYDWAHLAARYFPRRVEEKCKKDPSLAVAHGCFWKHHPARAYAWELRLQDELRPDFTIDEPDASTARVRFLSEQADEAQEIRRTEERRLERKRQKSARAEEEGDEAVDSGPLFDGAGADEEEHA